MRALWLGTGALAAAAWAGMSVGEEWWGGADQAPPGLEGSQLDVEFTPVVMPPPGGVVRLGDVAVEEVCLTGARFWDGLEGVVEVSGRAFEATTWSDTEVCAELPVGELTPGRLRVRRADGKVSNSVGLLLPARVEGWEIPERVTPSTSIWLVGENMAGVAVSGTQMLRGWADDQMMEFVLPRPGEHTLYVDGEEGPTVVVHPEMVRSCRVGPRTRCRVVANRFEYGGNVERVLVGGLEAQVHFVGAMDLEFLWPEGLEAGVHELRVEMGTGVLEGEVELLEWDRNTLVRFSPNGGYLGRQAQGLMAFDGHLLYGAINYAQGIGGAPEFLDYRLGKVPVDLRDRSEREEGGNGFGLQYILESLQMYRSPFYVQDGDRMLVLGLGSTGGTRLAVGVVDAGDEPGEWSVSQTSTGVLTTSVERVAAARFVEGAAGLGSREGLVAMLGKVKREEEEDLYGVRLLGLEGAPGVEALEAPVFGDTSVGWMSGGSVFVTTCGSSEVAAGVMRAGLLPGAGGQGSEGLEVGPVEMLVDGSDAGRRIVGCVGVDDGFYWMEEVEGEERLWWAGETGEPEEVMSVGAEMKESYERILALRVMANGDVWMLRGRNQGAARAVGLVVWRSGSGVFEEVESEPVRMNALKGEVCVGPWDDGDRCSDVGKYGCNLLACPVTFSMPVGGETMGAIGGGLYVSEEEGLVHVMVELERATMPSHSPYHRVELQHWAWSLDW